MDLYINDFSYQQPIMIANERTLISDFIDVCERARIFLFERLYMPDDYYVKEISNGFSFLTFVSKTQEKDALRIRLRGVLANQVRKMSVDEIDEAVQYVYWGNDDSEFFKKAHNKEVPVVSFRTHERFDENEFNIVCRYLDIDEAEISNNSELANLSNRNHFEIHNDLLHQKMLFQAEIDGKWNAINNPFRFAARMDQFLKETNYDERITGPGDENFKMALFFETGTAIAEMNGWVHDRRMSKINSTANKKRKVFYARNPTAYLSIDFMHGAFELHNRFGIHITEYNFRGLDLENTYSDKSHDLKI